MKRAGWRYLWTAPDIRRKLLITVALLVLYRFVAQIRVPGVDVTALTLVMGGSDATANFLNMVNLISGGTLRQFSILGMGVYPYITAQIVIQLLVPIIPAWQSRMEDDPREGRKWMEKNTYRLAILMGALTAFGQIQVVSNLGGVPIIPGFGFGVDSNVLRSVTVIISMTAGTMFAIWLGELISEYGIRGQGLSLLIFAGIIAQLPSTYLTIWNAPNNPNITVDPNIRWIGILAILIITILTIFVIVFVQQGRRNVPVMYPGRRVGNRMSMPVKGTLPLQVNMAGMIPLIFANALLQVPGLLGGLMINSEAAWIANLGSWMSVNITVNSGWYWLINFFFVVGFAFFYTDVLFAQQNYGENLKRSGAQIPGVSRGAATQSYLTRVLRRITFPGALFLGFIAVLPYLVTLIIPDLRQLGGGGSFLINSSGLLIVVGVVRDTFFNIEAELKVHGYDESLLVK
ncbi:MAG TPA: preprotein translocase subunit SecY [Anaerolineales bacterium]|nr:preprotein translocase subunit SecY [Anaerolineales bacterium]